MSKVFGCFDRCFVVNRDEDSVRMGRMAARLERFGAPFERFPALTPGPDPIRFADPQIQPAAYACAATHAAILRRMQDAGWESVLILEDDAVFRDDTPEWMTLIAPQLAEQPWDMFYLGLQLFQTGLRPSANLGRAKRANHSHAYAVSDRGVRRALDCIDRMLANPRDVFDSYSDHTLIKLYAIPLLAVQEPNYSWTLDAPIDRLSQYFAVFDGDDFERHCAEMTRWNSNWRAAQAFTFALDRAARSYRAGPMEDVAAALIEAIESWPEFHAEIRKDAGFDGTIRVLREGSGDRQALVDACHRVYQAMPAVKRKLGLP